MTKYELFVELVKIAAVHMQSASDAMRVVELAYLANPHYLPSDETARQCADQLIFCCIHNEPMPDWYKAEAS